MKAFLMGVLLVAVIATAVAVLGLGWFTMSSESVYQEHQNVRL
ncbi:MAG: hypothetical protein ACK5JT_00610 [Hyphomicrobiaceae bacterium]